MVAKQGIKQENVSSKFDVFKWVVAVLLCVSGFIANYYFIAIPWPIRTVGWLILVCIVVAIVLQTALGKRGWRFFKDARNEMRKVVWPSRQQTFQVTLLIIVIIIAFALIMWGVDSVLLWAVSWLTGQGG